MKIVVTNKNCICREELELAEREGFRQTEFTCPIHGTIVGGGPLLITLSLKKGMSIRQISDRLQSFVDQFQDATRLISDVEFKWETKCAATPSGA